MYENTDTLKTSKSSKISLSIMSVPDNPVPQLTFQEPVIDTYGEKGTTFYFRGQTVTYIPATSEHGKKRMLTRMESESASEDLDAAPMKNTFLLFKPHSLWCFVIPTGILFYQFAYVLLYASCL